MQIRTILLLSLCLSVVVGCAFHQGTLPEPHIFISNTKQSAIAELEVSPARMALESTCRLMSYDKATDEPVGYATVILVSLTSYIEGAFLERYIFLTAAHAIEPTEKSKIFEKFGNIFKIVGKESELYWSIQSYKYDNMGKVVAIKTTHVKPGESGVEIIRYESIDLAVIVLDVKRDLTFATPALTMHPSMVSSMNFWEEIILSGCPNDNRPLVREGRINQVSVSTRHPWINSVNCSIAPGDSGGGVFDTQGRLAGIVGITFGDGVGGGYIPLFLLADKLKRDRPEIALDIWR